jgi:4-amino-4-deoxy-L-arabinose transferase-like glycosyltransferase
MPSLNNKGHHLAAAGILLAAAFLIFFRLGDDSLHNFDEATYAQNSADMIRTGQWLDIRYKTDRANYPPLAVWLTSLAMKAFGVNEWSARLVSALFALLAVLLTIRLGSLLFSPWTGCLAGFIMATCLQFLYEHGARTGELDTVFLFFLLAFIYGLLLALLRKRAGMLILSGAALGLAAMTKNPLLCLIPAAAAGCFLIFSGRYRAFPLRTWCLAFLLPLFAVCLPWYGYQLIRGGSEFISAFFLTQVTDRVMANPFQRTSFYYLRIMMRGFFPWSFIAVPALIAALAGVWRSRKSPELFPLIMVIVTVAGFSLSELQFSWYIFPALPFFAILIASLVTGAGTPGQKTALPLFLSAAVLVPLFRLPMALYNPALFPAGNSPLRLEYRPGELTAAAWLLILGLAAAGAVLGCLAAPSGSLRKILAGAAVTGLILFALWQAAYPLSFAGHRSVEADFADRVAMLSGGRAAAVGIHDPIRFSLIYFYLANRDDLRLTDLDGAAPDVLAAMKTYPGRLFVVSVKSFNQLLRRGLREETFGVVDRFQDVVLLTRGRHPF